MLSPHIVAPAACKMEVKDLPQFEGLPSPEMEAGNNGLYASTLGMLDQWKMFNNGDTPDTSSGIDFDSGGSDLGSGIGGGGGGDPGSTGSLLSQKPKKRSSSVTKAAPAATAPAPAPVTVPFLAPQAVPVAAPIAAPAPSTARSYIISRPATGSAVSYQQTPPAAAAATRHTQQRSRQTLNYSVATAAAASMGQTPWVNATGAAAVTQKAGGQGFRHFNRTSHYSTRAATATAAMPAGVLEDDFDDGSDRPPLTSPQRRLFAAGKQQGKHVCNKGTATNSTTGPLGKSSFTGKVSNIVGITMADSGVIPADAAIAVGPHQVVHVVNGLVKILPVNSNGEFPKSLKPGQMRLIPLPDWFGLVASPCDGGYINPSATYDKDVGRFLISAICGGDTNQVVLSVSADSSAMGQWILYSFAGEATQGTRMQCINESYPISFHSQVWRGGRAGIMLFPLCAFPGEDSIDERCVVGSAPPARVLRASASCIIPLHTGACALLLGRPAASALQLTTVAVGTCVLCVAAAHNHSQVGYNKDGVFLSFIHNCPSNQETATGAMIYALPKWAVYKGATYFWSPVWTAWDIFDAVGQKNNEDYYPGAFIQMQPVVPQRAVDVQADVTYFVSDVS